VHVCKYYLGMAVTKLNRTCGQTLYHKIVLYITVDVLLILYIEGNKYVLN